MNPIHFPIFRSKLSFVKIFLAPVRWTGLAALLLLSSGCIGDKASHADCVKTMTGLMDRMETNTTNIRKTQDELKSAQTNLLAIVNEKEQRVSDRVEGAREANQQNPQNNEFTTTVEAELLTASGLLPAPGPGVSALTARKLKLVTDKSPEAQKELATMLYEERSKNTNLLQQLTSAQGTLDQKNNELSKQIEIGKTISDDAAKKTLQIKAAEEAANASDARAREAESSKARLHIAYLFMLVGGLVVVGAGVATYLHVPGVLFPGAIGGGGLFILGLLITVVNDLLTSRQ